MKSRSKEGTHFSLERSPIKVKVYLLFRIVFSETFLFITFTKNIGAFAFSEIQPVMWDRFSSNENPLKK